jgi:type I restriction-modification system DNA methylase subunit
MNADDFRDYILSFLFLRYLSNNYEVAVKNAQQDTFIIQPAYLWSSITDVAVAALIRLQQPNPHSFAFDFGST